MHKRKSRISLITSLVILDAVVLALALALAYYLRISSGILSYEGPSEFDSYSFLVVMTVPIWLLMAVFAHMYDLDQILSGPQEYQQVIKVCTFGIIALIVLSFLEHDSLLSRGLLLFAWVLAIILVGTHRFIFRRVVYVLRRNGALLSDTLVIGANEEAKAIVRHLNASSGTSLRVVGFLDDYLPVGAQVMDGLEVKGSPGHFERLVKETGAREVIIVPGALAWESFQEVIQHVASPQEGPTIKIAAGYYEILTTGVKLSHEASLPLMIVERVRITGVDALLKGILDFGLGVLFLVLASPLIMGLTLYLWILRSRPIFDRRVMLGLKGHPFPTLTFHTGFLHSPGSSFSSLSPAPSDNPRLFWAFLQRTGLVLLPQLVNVLRGKMSIVGPRSIAEDDAKYYGPWLKSLLTVKPGVIVPLGASDTADLDEEIRLTIYYIRNWTIWFDLQSILRTVKNIVQAAGSRHQKP